MYFWWFAVSVHLPHVFLARMVGFYKHDIQASLRHMTPSSSGIMHPSTCPFTIYLRCKGSSSSPLLCDNFCSTRPRLEITEPMMHREIPAVMCNVLSGSLACPSSKISWPTIVIELFEIRSVKPRFWLRAALGARLHLRRLHGEQRESKTHLIYHREMSETEFGFCNIIRHIVWK